MSNVTANTALVRGANGKQEVLLQLAPQGTALNITMQMSPDGARSLAKLLVDAADQAERVIVMPSFDGVPPRQA